jgi:glycine cleavage system protein P-like pyridoxal-binding family
MRIIWIALVALMASSCSQNHEEALALNNGEKWAVNEEMKPFINESMEVLQAYVDDKDNDYKALAAKLNTQNNALIQSCTMKGASHDELHKWLHPHLKLVESLDEAENVDGSKSIITELQTSFKTYNTYFQ